jgi:hypothetical protein
MIRRILGWSKYGENSQSERQFLHAPIFTDGTPGFKGEAIMHELTEILGPALRPTTPAQAPAGDRRSARPQPCEALRDRHVPPAPGQSEPDDARGAEARAPAERFFCNIAGYGNASWDSLPIAAAEWWSKSEMPLAASIVLAAFGACLNWGAVLTQPV